MTKKLFIKTYGCQMNVYDSTRMADVLAPLGYKPVQQPDGADIILLNTCHIREKASEKVFSELGRLRLLKEEAAAQGRQMLLGVAGCVAQAEGEEIVRRAPQVDLVFGPQTYHRLPELVTRALGQEFGRGLVDTDFPAESKFDHLPEEMAEQGPAAFLSVQEGCDKFCTFCVVPYTRGAEFSRPVADILREAKALMAAGTIEITLLGQNVNAFHGEGPDGKTWSLGRLIRELADLEGLERIRYTTSHPRDMDEELITAHGQVPQLMPYLHLPVQSGSDRVLDAMNRKHDADLYYRIVDQLREQRPDLALSSDFIVGFPGERDEDFADTLRLVSKVTFAQAYSFKYSPRPGTPAAGGEQQVDEAVKSERLTALQQLLNAQQEAFNYASVGQQMPVIFERRGKYAGQLIGRSPWMQSVVVEAPDRLLGSLMDVSITQAHANSLIGEVVTTADAVITGSSVTSEPPSPPAEAKRAIA
ncbi:tRNA (N6-isopentenyl adenosine(37)-C2)-methylthiotransferase MiaB [Rhodovibrionaceae bacterium A322]